MASLINEFELKHNNGTYLVIYQSRYYKISKLFFQILEEVKKLGSLKDAINVIPSTASLKNHEKEYIETQLAKKISSIKNDKGIKNRSRYIYFPFTILSEKIVEIISKKMRFFFDEKAFLILFLSFAIINIVGGLLGNLHVAKLSVQEATLYPILLFICLLFHELGHAVASCEYSGKAGKVGFGMYFRILPVFFADVTVAWTLEKKKRLIVNLGGIYLQLFVNVILLGILPFYPGSNVLQKLILINFYFTVYSLFPFFRNDGYWVISDGFEIPNLFTKSKEYIFLLLLKLEQFNWALFFYSILHTVFNIYLIFIFGKFFWRGAGNVFALVTGQEGMPSGAWSWILNVGTIIFCGYFVFAKIYEYFLITSKIRKAFQAKLDKKVARSAIQQNS